MAANSNPHDNTYNSTTFSGPVKAGSRRQTIPTYDRDTVPGTIAVTALPNAGYAICSQSAAVEQSTLEADVVDIVLPAYSMITSMQVIVTTAWTTTPTFRVGLTSDTGSQVAITGATTVSAVGVYAFVPDSGSVGDWKNINSDAGITDGNSVAIQTDSGSAGDGRGILTINYIPGLNL